MSCGRRPPHKGLLPQNWACRRRLGASSCSVANGAPASLRRRCHRCLVCRPEQYGSSLASSTGAATQRELGGGGHRPLGLQLLLLMRLGSRCASTCVIRITLLMGTGRNRGSLQKLPLGTARKHRIHLSFGRKRSCPFLVVWVMMLTSRPGVIYRGDLYHLRARSGK